MFLRESDRKSSNWIAVVQEVELFLALVVFSLVFPFFLLLFFLGLQPFSVIFRIACENFRCWFNEVDL